MVNVLVTVKYPPHKTEEVIKVYTSGKAVDYPDFVNRKFQWATPNYDLKIYNIYEIPDEKLVEGIKAIAKRFSTYVKVEGYKYNLEVLIEGAEALKMMM